VTRPSRPDLSAIAILDSNALFTENDVEVINPEFASAVADFREHGTEFVIPQIVIREIFFRKLVFLRRLETQLRRNLTTAARLTDKELEPVPSRFVLMLRMVRRWKKWSSAHGVRVARIPFNHINWKKLCSASVHRRVPFSPFDPNGKSEKGFRDALVIETLKYELSNRGTKKVVLISDDELVTQAADACGAGHDLRIYKSAAEYLSYLQLESKNFLQSLVRYILDEGAKAFYSAGEPTCIYTRFNIPHRILTEFPQELARKPAVSALDVFVAGTAPKTYSDATNDGFQLGVTSVRTYESETQRLLFTSTVRVGRAIRSSAVGELEQIRIADFKVDWIASWEPATYELKPIEVERLHAGEVTFETATDALLRSFNLPSLLDRIMATLPKPVLPNPAS